MRETITLKKHECIAINAGIQSTLIRKVLPKNRGRRIDMTVQPHESYPYYIRRKDGVWDSFKTKTELAKKHCPYSNKSGMLYGREPWKPRSWGHNFDWLLIEYKNCGEDEASVFVVNPWFVWPDELAPGALWEKLSNSLRDQGFVSNEQGCSAHPDSKEWEYPWQSPVTMPKGLSRFTLRIKSIDFKRFFEITEEDAILCGIDYFSFDQAGLNFDINGYEGREPLDAFKALHSDDLDAGDWVWLISFEKLDKATP